MVYGNKPPLFDVMQNLGTSENFNRIMRNLPPRTINESYLELIDIIVKQLEDNGFIVDESGLKNYNKDQPIEIGFNKDEIEYKFHVRHTGENTLSEVAMFIQGGKHEDNKPKYKGNIAYTPQKALQEIINIIKNN